MLGLVSIFLITLAFAFILTVGIIITLRQELSSIFGKKTTDASNSPVSEKADLFQSLGRFLAMIFFTIALWYISFDTARDIWHLFKTGS